MNIRAFFFVSALVLGFAPAAPISARADTAKRQCLLEAQQDFDTCKDTCKETRDLDRVVCGVNPDCKKGCVAEFEACREPYLNILKNCKDACRAAFEVGRDSCKASTNCGNKCEKDAAYLDCRRPFAIADFACRQVCQDNKKTDTTTRSALKVCNQTLNACTKACNKATPVPSATPAS